MLKIGDSETKLYKYKKKKLKRTIYQTPFKLSLHITFISMITLLFLSPIMNAPCGHLFLLRGFISILIELSTYILAH